MPRARKPRSKHPKAAPPADNPEQSNRFLAMAREVADVTPEIFERAFRKVAVGQLAKHRLKRKRK